MCRRQFFMPINAATATEPKETVPRPPLQFKAHCICMPLYPLLAYFCAVSSFSSADIAHTPRSSTKAASVHFFLFYFFVACTSWVCAPLPSFLAVSVCWHTQNVNSIFSIFETVCHNFIESTSGCFIFFLSIFFFVCLLLAGWL